jgi:hypothetical protein
VALVVDVLIEEIRRGLEHPIVQNNQRRFGVVKFFTELYYYRVVSTTTVFNVCDPVLYIVLVGLIDQPLIQSN